jgi:glycosyltransferase involved in cell wall biosynthesis
MRSLGHALAARGWKVEVWTTTAVDEATWATGFAPGRESDGDVDVRRFPVTLGRLPWLFRQFSHAAFHLPGPLRGEHLWSIVQGPYSSSLIRALATAESVPTLFSPYLYHPTLYGLPAAPHPRILCPAAHDEPSLRLNVVDRAMMSADALWFHSAEERDLVLKTHPRTASKPSRCGVVGVTAPDAVDQTAFASRHGISGPYLYYGGRVAGGKGFDTLIDGADLLHRSRPDVRLVLSGDAGDGHEHLRPWVYNARRLSEGERWEAIAGAVAVVVPGTLESLSLLALEAWAMGRPCLLNGDSAVLAGHVVRGGGGRTFRGVQEFSERARELLDDPSEAAALGESGRAYVAATYRWDLAEERLRALIAVAPP